MSAASVQNGPTASDERIRNVLRREIDRAINIDRTLSRAELAEASGVNVHTIDSIKSTDAAKHRSIHASVAFSLAWAMGERAVNALLSVIAFGNARSLDEAEADCPLDSAVTAMGALSRFMGAAADRRIDHMEERDATEACDIIIAQLMPFSSAGKR